MKTTAFAPKKIMIIDDHDLVRIAIKALLSHQPELVIVAEASCGLEAIQLAKVHSPDIILLDIELPDLSGVEVAKRLLHIRPFRIIALTSHTDSFYIGQLLRLGVSGYLSKNCQHQELLQVLLEHKAATPYIDQKMLAEISQNLFNPTQQASPFDELSQRELEILLLLCHGEKPSHIGQKLFLSTKTVLQHRQKLFKKMQVSSNADLAKLAFEHNLIDKNS
jgi:two-component system invasion response regulator UvrY